MSEHDVETLVRLHSRTHLCPTGTDRGGSVWYGEHEAQQVCPVRAAIEEGRWSPPGAARAGDALPRLIEVPSEEAMYGLLVALNYGANPEVACVDGGRAFVSTLTDPDADHVNYVYPDESGHSRCIVGCENCGSEGNQRHDWKPTYPVTVILAEQPDLDRAAEDGVEEADWLRTALAARAAGEAGGDLAERVRAACDCGHTQADHLNDHGVCQERDRFAQCGCTGFTPREAAQ